MMRREENGSEPVEGVMLTMEGLMTQITLSNNSPQIRSDCETILRYGKEPLQNCLQVFRENGMHPKEWLLFLKDVGPRFVRPIQSRAELYMIGDSLFLAGMTPRVITQRHLDHVSDYEGLRLRDIAGLAIIVFHKNGTAVFPAPKY